MVNEQQIEYGFIGELTRLKYIHRPDIRDRTVLEANFRQKFEALNRVTLSDAEFSRLRDEIVNPDVFQASKTLRGRNAFTREDGTPLNYTLVNIKEWCKNDFEVVNQLRINTANSHHRYDVILLLNGLPLVQIELKTLEVSPRRAMQQIVDYKADPGNGYTHTLLCFIQLFVVSNRSNTFYFANNRAQHFAFSADEQFLPVYQYAAEDNRKITQLSEFADKFLAKCTLAELISRYMVLVESEQKLLVMRPYQMYAVKAIVDCIHQTGATATSGTPPAAARRLPRSRPRPCSRTTPTLRSAFSWWTAKTWTARPARSSTSFRRAAWRKTPTPGRWCGGCSRPTTPIRSS